MDRKIAVFTAVFIAAAIIFSPMIKMPLIRKAKAVNCVWKEIASQSSQSLHPTENIVFDETDISVMYGINKSSKLLRSTDYGKHWTLIANSLPPNVDITRISTVQDKVFAATTGGVFESESQGENWTKLFSLYTTGFDTDKSNTNIMFAGTDSGKIYKSVNGGNSWGVVANVGSRINEISVSGPNGRYAIAATNGGLYKTSNGGSSWKKTYGSRVYTCKINPLDPSIAVMIAKDPDGNPLKILVSQNGGFSWSQPAKLKPFTVYDFAFDPQDKSTFYLATEKNGIVKAENLGENIAFLSDGMPYRWTSAVSVNPAFSNVIYAVGVEFNPSAKYHLYYLSCPVQSAENLVAYFDSNAIRLSWNYRGSQNPERFEVYYKPEGALFFVKLKTVKGNKTACSEDAKKFAPDIKYEFTVKACTGPNCSASVTDTAMRLKNPRILDVILYSNTENTATLRVSWDTTSIDKNAEYITIFRNDPDCTGWLCFPVAVKTIKRSDLEFGKGFTSIPGLKPNREYKVFISANEEKYGAGIDYSTSDFKKIFVPGIPQDFEAYSIGKYVYFSWKFDKDAQNEIDKFIISARDAQLPEIEVSKNMRKAKSGVIAKSRGYEFILYVVKGKAKTHSSPDEAFILRTPEKPSLEFAQKGITIKWDKDSIDPNANEVEIARLIGASTYMTIAVIDKNAGEFTDKFAQQGTCRYIISAVRTEEGKHSDRSEFSQVAEINFVPPASPSSLSAEKVTCESVILVWNDNSDNEEKFVIERKEQGKSFGAIGTTGKNETQFADKTTEEGKTYVYRVKAVNGAGSSKYSNEITVSVPMCEKIPDAPTNLTVSVSERGTVMLSWADNSDNEEGFVIERKENGEKFTVTGKTGRDETAFEDKNVSKGKTYVYRVKAFNKKGESAYSNEAEITIPGGKITIVLQPDNPLMIVNGKKQEIDPGRGTKPVIIPKWSRTVVPIRAIVEALGGTIEWDGKERKVTINFNGTTIELWIDNPKARVNGKEKWIDEKNHDVRPIIINDRTMLPLRFVAENLGCNVDWDPKTRMITITYIP